MFERIKKFLQSEDGYTVESLSWQIVLGLGAASLFFGIYVATRYLSAGIGDDVKDFTVPSSLPTATEYVSEINAGYTGAITSLVIEE